MEIFESPEFNIIRYLSNSYIFKSTSKEPDFLNSIKERILLNTNDIIYKKNIPERNISFLSRIENSIGNFICNQISEYDYIIYIYNHKTNKIKKVNYFISPHYYKKLPNDTTNCFNIIINELKNSKSHNFRSRNIDSIYNQLDKYFLDKNLGICNMLLDNYDGPFPISVAMLPLDNGKEEPGVGRTRKIQRSRAVALLEAYERYSGLEPRGKKTINHTEDLKSKKVNMNSLILHNNPFLISHGIKNSNFTYNDLLDNEISWVKCLNLNTFQTLLIPEQYAYYGINISNHKEKAINIAYEISNGCSVGNNYLEVVYYGLMEVIERDSFLCSWYFNTPKDKISLKNASTSIKNLIQQFTSYYNDYKLELFYLYNEFNIPVVLATVTLKESSTKKMNFMCAAAADINIEDAIEKSIHEIGGILFGLNKKFIDRYHELEAIRKNNLDVKTMEDHTLVYGLPEHRTYIQQKMNYENIYDYDKELTPKIFYKEVQKLIKKISTTKDILLVDQTPLISKKIDLKVGKIIVPGLLPMTFGKYNIRVSENRYHELCHFYSKDLIIDLNPHPFP
uniref:TclJ n=1 Tax=Macrococcoides caseolyticum TaxID=69966 RepID=A0A097PT71_9STAP|nr:YcaO-like family protein [Macrococcus caseolyticus]AIU53945.1 TclJ [Macrococcus caseolyticus]